MNSLHEEKIDFLLNYWFGKGEWRASLWFQGIDSSQAAGNSQSQKLANKDAQARTDKFIENNFGDLITQIVNDEKTDINDEFLSSKWITSTTGQVALIILLDQFTRNAFRGTSDMFSYDPIASVIAIKLIHSNDYIYLPWNFKLFVCICLTHSEKEETVNTAALKLSSLVSELKAAGDGDMSKRVRRVMKATEDHLAVLEK